MFDLKNAPPGFEDIRFPGSEEEEKYDPSTDPTLNGDDFNQGDFGPTTDDFDPTAVALTDGSLQQELALGMQNAVDEMRERVGQSIEQIMLEQVNNQPDGLGPCTTVDCLLRASVEAARIFIFEKQMQQQNNDMNDYHGSGDHHDNYDNYDDNYEKGQKSGDC